MSLLNDALKKAQNIQAPLKPAFPAPTQPVKTIATPVTSHMPEPRPKSGPNITMVLMIAGVVFVVTAGVLGVGGYFLLSKVNDQPGPEIAQATAAPAPAVAAPAAASVPAPIPAAAPVVSFPVVSQPASAPAEPVMVSPAAPAPAPTVASAPEPEAFIIDAPVEPATATQQPTPTAPAASPRPRPKQIPEPEDAAAAIVATVVEFPKASNPAPTTEPAETIEFVPTGEEGSFSDDGSVEIVDESSVVIINNIPEANELPTRATGVHPDPKIQSWVAQIEVSGVRMGPSPKVLMNDRVFTTGDYVDRKTRLKLTGIEERTLIFQDPDGNTYELYF